MTTLGNTETIGEFELWNAEIFNLSGGALEPGYFELSTQDICSLGCPPGQNPLPIYPYGWVADYPDPSDFMAPMYYPDNCVHRAGRGLGSAPGVPEQRDELPARL